jgi:hypothetical protein
MQATKEVGMVSLICPYCENLDALRDECLYCCGHGYVPGPKLYGGEANVFMQQPPRDFERELGRAHLLNLSMALLLFACAGLLLLWRLGAL